MRAVCSAVLGLFLLTWATSWAGSFEEPLPKGTIEWGIMAGYGLSNALGPSKAEIDFITLMPRVGYVFAESRRTPPLRGSLQGVVEAVPALVAFEDAQTIYGGGFNLLLHYDVATGTRVVPFLEGGAGILLSTPQSTDRRFPVRGLAVQLHPAGRPRHTLFSHPTGGLQPRLPLSSHFRCQHHRA